MKYPAIETLSRPGECSLQTLELFFLSATDPKHIYALYMLLL